MSSPLGFNLLDFNLKFLYNCESTTVKFYMQIFTFIQTKASAAALRFSPFYTLKYLQMYSLH